MTCKGSGEGWGKWEFRRWSGLRACVASVMGALRAEAETLLLDSFSGTLALLMLL